LRTSGDKRCVAVFHRNWLLRTMSVEILEDEARRPVSVGFVFLLDAVVRGSPTIFKCARRIELHIAEDENLLHYVFLLELVGRGYVENRVKHGLKISVTTPWTLHNIFNLLYQALWRILGLIKGNIARGFTEGHEAVAKWRRRGGGYEKGEADGCIHRAGSVLEMTT